MHGVQRKKFHRFVERSMGILRHLFIISITAGGGRLRGGRNTLSSRHTCAHPSSAYVTYLHFTKRKRKCLFSHPRLSPALLNYVCHPSPRICCSNIYLGQWYNQFMPSTPPLFIATRLSNPRKRSWIIISRLSTRERYGENLSRLRNFHRSTSLCWKRRSRSFVLI